MILHVIESYGAGSARAAETYAIATPRYRHVVLRRTRVGEYVQGQELRAFSAVHDLPSGALAAMRSVREVVRSVRPVRIHAHSSWAGAFVRIALPLRVARRRVVYTPHCFAFERKDLSIAVRAAFGLAEAVLALKTDVIAACSERERRLARRFLTRRAPILVPNVSSLPTPAGTSVPEARVIGIGRVGLQKDPDLFARITSAARSAGVIDDAAWLGGGDPDVESRLRASGLRVSGWATTEAIAEECAAAAVYLHTAQWEGFPLSILEAARSGSAVIARRIPALTGSPEEWLFDSEDEAVEMIRRVRTVRGGEQNRQAWSRALADNDPEVQRSRLDLVYRGTGT